MRKLPALVLILSLTTALLPSTTLASHFPSEVLFISHFEGNTKEETGGNSGTSSGVTFSTGKFSNGVTFDASDYLYYSASGDIDHTKGTVEFWYKPSSSWADTSSTQVTLFMYDNNSQATGWAQEYLAIFGAGGPITLRVELKGDSGTVQLTDSTSTSWKAGELHHIAVTWSSSSLKLYSDGALRAEQTSPPKFTASRDTIFIGNDMFLGGTTAEGTIDEFVIRNIERSASDISSDYLEGAAFYPEPAATPPDTTSPSISAIAAVNLTKTTAAITWTTNETSDSVVEYGTTTSYGKILSQETDSVTSHSVLITGLSLGTTYHYRVKSKDSYGNQSTSADHSFTTLDIDKIPPKVSFDPYELIYATSSAMISGTATDNQSGVASLSYTLDGTNFLPIKGTGKFSIELELEDGNYRLQIKAVDVDGNEGLSSPARFVVDNLPPRVGGSSLFLGHQKLFPNEGGVITVPAGSKLSIVSSVVGGATMVQIQSSGSIQSLTKIPGTNLWQGEIAFSQEDQFNLEAYSVDGAGNEVVQQLNSINVRGKGVVTDTLGEVVEGAEVSLFIWIDNISPFTTGEWKLWQADSHGQQNPQVADKRGTYSYLVPQGRYQLAVIKEGFRDFVSEPFTLEKITPINATMELESKLSLNLFGNKYSLPWFLDIFAKKSEITIDSRALKEQAGELVRGKKAVDFSLPSSLGGERNLTSYAGRKILITFWTTWDPSSVEQIAILDETEERKDVVLLPVALQESRGRVKSYLARGKYLIGSLIDENGDLLENYKIQALPQHYLIGEDGIIKETKVGILSKEKIRELTD